MPTEHSYKECSFLCLILEMTVIRTLENFRRKIWKTRYRTVENFSAKSPLYKRSIQTVIQTALYTPLYRKPCIDALYRYSYRMSYYALYLSELLFCLICCIFCKNLVFIPLICSVSVQIFTNCCCFSIVLYSFYELRLIA